MNDIDLIQCRASNGVALTASKPWEPGKPVEFIYAPAGRHNITAGFRKGETITICLENDEQTAIDLQASFDHLTATEPNQEPFGDEEHDAKKATLRFPAGVTNFKWGQIKSSEGVIVCAEPTSYGSEAVNGKVYRSWSPEFATDAAYAKARQKNGHWTFPDGVRGSESNPARIVGVSFVMGALTNKPAFRAMPPVKAKKVEERGEVQASGLSAGGFSAEEHEALGKMHQAKADRLFKSRGERKSGLLGGERDRWYHANTHEMVSGYHNSAAEHLKSGDVSKAEEAANLARHHNRTLPESNKFRNSISNEEGVRASEPIPFSSLLATVQAALPEQEVVNIQHEGGNEFTVLLKTGKQAARSVDFLLADDGSVTLGEDFVSATLPEAYAGECLLNGEAVKAASVGELDFKQSFDGKVPSLSDHYISEGVGGDKYHVHPVNSGGWQAYYSPASKSTGKDLGVHKTKSKALDACEGHFCGDEVKSSDASFPLSSIYSKATTQEGDSLAAIYEREGGAKAAIKGNKPKDLNSIYAKFGATGTTAPAIN